MLAEQFNLAGRAGTVDDTTRVVLFLLGPGGDYIDGVVVPVDGGIAEK